MKIYPVINILIIKSHYGDISSQTTILHINEDITEYEVEWITKERKNGKEFRIKWKGYIQETWKLIGNLRNAKDILVVWKNRKNPSTISRNDQ